MNISYREYLYLNSKLLLIAAKRRKALVEKPSMNTFKVLDVLTEAIGKRMGYYIGSNNM